MWTVFRTSRAPVQYRASDRSVAYVFRVLCVAFIIVFPVAVCGVALARGLDVVVDRETPSVKHGRIVRFEGRDRGGRLYVCPDPRGESTGEDAFALATAPVLRDGRLVEWVVSLAIPGANASEMISVALAFTFTAGLSRWARNSLPSVATFSGTFPLPAHAGLGAPSRPCTRITSSATGASMLGTRRSVPSVGDLPGSGSPCVSWPSTPQPSTAGPSAPSGSSAHATPRSAMTVATARRRTAAKVRCRRRQPAG